MRTSLVTGAAGFVGGAVAEALVRRGDHVICLARLSRPMRHRPVLFDAEWAIGDVADADFVRDLVARKRPDEVYHYAASSIVQSASDDPAGAVRTNMLGTVALLDACRTAHRPQAILVASSDKAYGSPREPAAETDALRPERLYDATKAAQDFLSLAYATDHGLPIVITRSANIYGPGDLNWSRIVPGSCRRIVAGERPVLYRDAAEMVREFIYVDDYVAAALLLAGLTCCHRIARGSAFNIGTGDIMRVGRLIDEIVAASGRPVTVEIRDREGFGELASQSVRAEKLRATGWLPTVPLRDGLVRTWRWYENFLQDGGAR